MRILRYLVVAAVGPLALGLAGCEYSGVAVGAGFGPEPGCPYGYYDYAPYSCAPYGYYGPEWFNGGVFVGAGPWYHGPRKFYGHVDTHFDTRAGYTGPLPDKGPHQEHPDHFQSFHGTEMHDGRGHVRH